MISILLGFILCCLSTTTSYTATVASVQHRRGRSSKQDVKPASTGSPAKAMKQLAKDSSKTKKAFNGPVISVELYYETLCPDCIGFLNQTVGPMWQDEDLRAAVNLTLYPYGNAQLVPKSKISEGYKFWHPATTGKGFENVAVCQHGADECFGNLIQACAISMVPHDTSMAFILCMASHPEYSIEKASYECMTQNKMDVKKVKDCVQSSKGNELITALAKQTDSIPGRDWTPWIMIDGKHLTNSSDLVPTICTKVSNLIAEVGGSTPETCQPYAQAPGSQDPDFVVFNKMKSEVKSEKTKNLLNMALKAV